MIFFGITGQEKKDEPDGLCNISFTYPENAAILNKIANYSLLKAVKNAA